MAHAQSPARLPDAPSLAGSTGPTASASPRAGGPNRGWRPYVDPGQTIRPLSAGQKMKFWLHLEAVPWSPAPSFVSAAFEQGIDGNPKFGADSGAFGERLGAAFVRDATMRFFVSSLFPVVFREDPRYYRVAHGGIVFRGLRSAQQALVTHTDSGHVRVNYSDLLGHLAACALTPLYYPAPSANGSVVVEAWATSIAGDAGNNLLLEFVPSLVNQWQRHRLRSRAHSESLRSSSIP